MLHDTHPGQIAFPAEIICHILCFLSTREIIRLRRISKLFRDLTCDPALWKTLYANARLPRPPGPFPSQSTQFLERTLVQSERLALTWASQPIKVTSRDLVRTQLSASPPQWCVLCGRWFIWCETTQILCRDLDAGRLQVLWDGYAQISHFCACAVTSVDGQRVYILLHGKQPDQLQGELTKMLEFEVDDHSCSFSVPVSLDIPLQPGGPPFSISGHSEWLINSASDGLSATGAFQDAHNCGLSLVWSRCDDYHPPGICRSRSSTFSPRRHLRTLPYP
ncbi:hypothetical protein BS17DRAFT_330283 [Gyrodon lividus]|nr:hypothetical protein BS17DRAFT_330283 [Gyrodon lividus]